MSFRTDFQSQLAQAVVAVYSALGDTVSYTNRGGTTRTGIVAGVQPETITFVEYMGLPTEISTRIFDIPKQTDFPEALGINIGDVVLFDSIPYNVDEIEDNSGGYKAVWKLTCSHQYPAKAGIKAVL